MNQCYFDVLRWNMNDKHLETSNQFIGEKTWDTAAPGDSFLRMGLQSGRYNGRNQNQALIWDILYNHVITIVHCGWFIFEFTSFCLRWGSCNMEVVNGIMDPSTVIVHRCVGLWLFPSISWVTFRKIAGFGLVLWTPPGQSIPHHCPCDMLIIPKIHVAGECGLNGRRSRTLFCELTLEQCTCVYFAIWRKYIMIIYIYTYIYI